MPIEVNKEGTPTSYVGRDAVEVFRLQQLLKGLRLQKVGIRMSSRLPQATTIARRQYGCKGNIDKIIEQVEVLIQKQLTRVVIVEDQST
jgi:hypothetical protein